MTDDMPDVTPDVTPAESDVTPAETEGDRIADASILERIGDLVDKLRDMTSEDESPRVRTQANLALVAVAERVCRMMRRDVAG